MADVAVLAQLPASTLSRLWRDSHWLDRVSGATLQQLIAAMPGLAQYVERRSHAVHLESVLRRCGESGLAVRSDRLADLITDGQSGQHLAAALTAAASMMRMNTREATAHLARCWGGRQSVALDVLTSPAPDGILAEPNVLVEKAHELIGIMNIGTNSLHATVGHGILVHKVTKLTGVIPVKIPPSTPERSSAFAYRSGIIGTLLTTSDHHAATAYHRQLASNPLLRRNELWSLATFSGDIAQSPDFTVAAKAGLRRTAADMITDIINLNEGYLHYLITSAIPVVLEYDSSFGSVKEDLRQALRRRLDRGIADGSTRTASSTLLKSLQ